MQSKYTPPIRGNRDYVMIPHPPIRGNRDYVMIPHPPIRGNRDYVMIKCVTSHTNQSEIEITSWLYYMAIDS